MNRLTLMVAGLLGFFSAVSSLFVAVAADDFPPLRNSEADQSAHPMPAKQAAAEMQLPDGFVATVFAQEPEVQNPIAMAWDHRGRLWVAENFTYAESKQRFDLSFRDRVLVFEDTNHDGVADSRTVFTDQVQMLTSVEVGHGGVWLMCPPQLLFIPDADNDLVPDGPAQVVLDGFEVAQANYHNYANGLRFGPDGWLYGRCGGSCPGKIGAPGTPDEKRFALEGGIWRYHPLREQVEVLAAGTTNPWGHDWNEWGELFFVNTVNGHFWHGIAGAHFARPFNLDPNPRTYETIDTHADHYHFDTGKSWTASRDGAANSLGGGHAHCGAMFYLGDQWPESYRGKFFTANFHGRRLNQESVVRHGSGYVARHDPDFCIVTDPFFRGMDLLVGPDGAVAMSDWSDTGECHDHTGVHRTSGRIYQLAFGKRKASARVIDLPSLTPSELVGLHESGDEWLIRQVRLELAHRVGRRIECDAALKTLARMVEQDEPLTATRAAMTLVACGKADKATALGWTEHASEHVRSWAVRALVDAMPIDDVYGPRQVIEHVDNDVMGALLHLAGHDASGLVRLHVASAMQRLPIASRAAIASALMSREADADDHNLPLLVWYGLMPVADSEPDSLVPVAMQSKWPKTQRLIARRLAETMHENMRPLDDLIKRIILTEDTATRTNIIQGVEEAMKGWIKAPQPKTWADFAASVTAEEGSLTTSVRELSVVFGDGRAMKEIRQLVLDPKAEVGLRRSALISLVNQKHPDLQEVCVQLLGDQRLSAVAAKGLALFDDPENARRLIKNYGRFRGTDRPQVIAALVSRKSFASELLDAIGDGTIPRAALSAYDARQIRSYGDGKLSQRLSDVWGETRESPRERKEAMEKLKTMLLSTDAPPPNLSQGRVVYRELCGKCHRMYGEGEKIGPDLTGSQRENLDYLVENIVDPSAVVSKDYRVSVISMIDGRVLNGVVVSKSARTLSLQTQTELLVLGNDDIDEIKQTAQSPMPDGQLDALSESQIRDLFGYLRHPSQVPLP